MTGAAPRDPAFATTSRSLLSARQNVPRSAAAFLAVMAGLVVIKLAVARLAPQAYVVPAQAQVLAWPVIGALTIVGLIGVWFASRTGFPETWDPRVPVRHRLLLPVVTGLIFGAIAMVVDALTGWTTIAAPYLHHMPFPASLLIYPGFAVIGPILDFLVPIPLVMWLAGFVLQGRWTKQAFWVAGAFAAAIEPLTYDLHAAGHPGIVVAMFAQQYAFNLAQVATFRRAGFGASLVLQITFFLVWHVLWGALRS